jgi:hypothetical protein
MYADFGALRHGLRTTSRDSGVLLTFAGPVFLLPVCAASGTFFAGFSLASIAVPSRLMGPIRKSAESPLECRLVRHRLPIENPLRRFNPIHHEPLDQRPDRGPPQHRFRDAGIGQSAAIFILNQRRIGWTAYL